MNRKIHSRWNTLLWITEASLIFILISCSPRKSLEIQAITAIQTVEPGTVLPSVLYPTLALPAGRVRTSVIAGSWYPANPQELASMVDGFLNQVQPVDGAPLALIVPHAGYVYSGVVAAAGFKQMEGHEYDVAVIIAADHQMPLSNPISVWAEGGFETPLGTVPVDVDLANALLAQDSRIKADLSAHENEHPVEIELPFLQRVCPKCAIVPILVGSNDDETMQVLVRGLSNVLLGKRAVVIASSDLSHYPSAENARRVDSSLLAAVESGDPQQVSQVIQVNMSADIPNLETCACGENAILVAMNVARQLGAETVTVLKYANSADSSYGNPEQVVGYGAVMFWHYQPPAMGQEQRDELLKLARSTILTKLTNKNNPSYQTSDPDLSRKSGVFVTLKLNGELRGCIGTLQANLPLYQAVQEMAISAATADPRFPPLTTAELERVKIEISILSPFCRVNNLEQIRIGTDGLVIVHKGHQGVFLPQVPTEQGWDRQEYLENLCEKAGLDSGCWKEQPTLYSFTAVVFGEQ